MKFLYGQGFHKLEHYRQTLADVTENVSTPHSRVVSMEFRTPIQDALNMLSPPSLNIHVSANTSDFESDPCYQTVFHSEVTCCLCVGQVNVT